MLVYLYISNKKVNSLKYKLDRNSIIKNGLKYKHNSSGINIYLKLISIQKFKINV